MLPHVKRSSIEAVVRGSAARRLVFAQGPGRGLQALRWALPSGVSRALPEKLLLKQGASACQKPPALAGGVVTLVTPFDERENIDEESLRRVVDFNIDAGVHGLGIALGSEILKL